MPRLPESRTETCFSESRTAWTTNQALVEAWRCLYCHDAPCVEACPTRIDVPEFIRRIRTLNWRGSARTILDQNVLGASCARVCPVEVLCVGACVLPRMGLPAVQVGRLQRFVTDMALDHGWRLFRPGPPTGKRVALVGAGPASLACAHELVRLGHACTLFERDALPGGLNSHGIAPYKMKADCALAEVEYVLGIGSVDLRTGVEMGTDVPWDTLERDFDAVFLGVGLGLDRLLSRLPGADLGGVEGALAFIDRMKLDRVDVAGVHSAVVVGGGNTAVDLVRELLGLGVPRVTLVYRRDQSSMRAYAAEWEQARLAGARAEWRAAPQAFLGDGTLSAVRCSRLGPDLIPDPAGDFTIEADRCFVAVGQSRLDRLQEALAGITLKDGRLVVDEHGFTGRPGWYAAGDCTNGGREVVHAVAGGRDAARAIHAHLAGASA